MILFYILVTTLYFLPTIMAIVTKQHNVLSIFVINLFLGWTVVGWVLALSWAVKK